jgi:hypothetical protein
LAFLAAIYPNRSAYHHETALVEERKSRQPPEELRIFGEKALKIIDSYHIRHSDMLTSHQPASITRKTPSISPRCSACRARPQA